MISQAKQFILRHPLSVFFVLLGLLLVFILLGNVLRAPSDTADTRTPDPKTVRTVSSEETPRVTLLAQTDKQGVVTVTAQTSGIVSKIFHTEGDRVSQGQPVLFIADTADGSSAAAINQRLTQKTEELTQEVTERQVDIADGNIDNLIPKNSDTENWIARKQSEIAKWNARLNQDIAQLQNEQSAIVLSLQSPASPIRGTLERVLVHPGESVTPGTPLFVIFSEASETILDARIPADIARRIDVTGETLLMLDGVTHTLHPSHLSSEASLDGEYSLLFSVPKDLAKSLTHTRFYELSLPLKRTLEDSSALLIPIDAVHITRDSTFAYVVTSENTAASREVQTGAVFGNFVLVQEGLHPEDTVILSRNVSDGELIRTDETSSL